MRAVSSVAVRDRGMVVHGAKNSSSSPVVVLVLECAGFSSTRTIELWPILSGPIFRQPLALPSGNCARARHRFRLATAERARRLADEAIGRAARCSLRWD